jgi:hypothetical protein
VLKKERKMDVSDAMEYFLSAELVGHDRDVRGVAGLRNGAIASSSRDCTVRIWDNEPVEGIALWKGFFLLFFFFFFCSFF